MIILGIDPALTSLGWGVIEVNGSNVKYIASGVIKTTNSQQMPIRLAFILSKIEELILSYRPVIVAMEEIFVNSNAVSSIKLGYARGVVMAMVGKYKIELQEFKPNMVKKTVVGYGHAEKSQICYMINILMSLSANIKSFDESDAIAVAYTCFITNKCKIISKI